MNSHDEDNTAWRRALRQAMASRRAALAGAEHEALSARIVAHALATLPKPRVAAFCWPIKHEPDVRPLLASWRSADVRAALPVVVAESEALRFREWSPDSRLEADRYGIPTPSAGEWLTPDLILLPLNGFDGAGYRLGYGGGYFDRTLAALSPRPLAVGVGFEINRVASIRPEAHDQRLDWIITENGAFRPTA
ncbi:MAG TPA: 5-formyltetrahydrofolate cyclo-ligase [Azonexus sp.]|nr:5-formyltetrahydrofolate cyclo-ligase [Azonexus sp.]